MPTGIEIVSPYFPVRWETLGILSFRSRVISTLPNLVLGCFTIECFGRGSFSANFAVRPFFNKVAYIYDIRVKKISYMQLCTLLSENVFVNKLHTTTSYIVQ